MRSAIRLTGLAILLVMLVAMTGCFEEHRDYNKKCAGVHAFEKVNGFDHIREDVRPLYVERHNAREKTIFAKSDDVVRYAATFRDAKASGGTVAAIRAVHADVKADRDK